MELRNTYNFFLVSSLTLIEILHFGSGKHPEKITGDHWQIQIAWVKKYCATIRRQDSSKRGQCIARQFIAENQYPTTSGS